MQKLLWAPRQQAETASVAAVEKVEPEAAVDELLDDLRETELRSRRKHRMKSMWRFILSPMVLNAFSEDGTVYSSETQAPIGKLDVETNSLLAE